MHLLPEKGHFSNHISSVSYKDSCNGNVHLESLESSLKKLALKSAVVTEPFYNSFELSERASQKIIEISSLNVSCAKELQFSQLSASNNSSVYNNINHEESRSDYSSAAESDMNSSELLDSTSNMSRSRRFTRSSIASTRSLSSDDESDISVQRIVRPRKSVSNLNFTPSGRFYSERETNSQNFSNNHALDVNRLGANSHYTRYQGNSDGDSQTNFSESSYSDRSAVQSSVYHRFRWFLWKCIYLKLIKTVNFDVWFLSRLHNHGKLKFIFALLLPLLIYFFWGISQSSSLYESASQKLNPVISIFEFLSSIFSSIFGYFFQRKEEDQILDNHPVSCDSDSSIIYTFFHGLSSVFSVMSSWLVRTGESASLMIGENYNTKDAMPHHEKLSSEIMPEEEIKFTQQEKIKLIQPENIKFIQPNEEEIKILKSEINSFKEFMITNMQRTEMKVEKDQNLKNEISNLRLEFLSLSRIVGGLEKDIMRQSEKSKTKEDVISLTSDYKKQIEHLNIKLKTIETKLSNLEQLKSCCDKQWNEENFAALLEKHLFLAFKSVVDSDPNSKYYFFNEWLSSTFFNHEKLMQLIQSALLKEAKYNKDTEMSHDNVIKVVESTVLKHVDSIKRNLSELNKSSYSSFSADLFSEDKVKKIVKEAIMLYDADKIGQVDYALESGGGSVLGTRCSETYVEKYGKLSIFGVPLWTNSNSPRTAIQPDVQPGRCWAFKGSQGFLVIELSAIIYPTGFTLEHIPVSLSPTGSIDSAPKNFSVWGLDSEKDSSGNLLGEYWYDVSGEPLQYFAVQKPSEKPYSYVELQIHSNHGNMEYTCLYRFRVHGKRVR